MEVASPSSASGLGTNSSPAVSRCQPSRVSPDSHDCHSACQEAVRRGLSNCDSHVGNQRFSVKRGKELVAAEAQTLSRRENKGVGGTLPGRQAHVVLSPPGITGAPGPWRMCNRVKALTRRVAVLTIDGP